MTPEELVKYADELGLNDGQRRFLELWASDPEHNGSAAAIKAGYKPGAARITASRTLALPKAKKYVEALLTSANKALAKRTAKSVLAAADILEGLSEQARASYEDFITINPDGSFAFDLLKAQQAGKLHLIEDLAHDRETGAPVVKLPSRRAAMMDLAKLLRMTGDVQEQPNVTHNQVLAIFGQMPTDQLLKLREALAKKE